MYERSKDGKTIFTTERNSSSKLIIAAQDWREERTGLHAKIAISYNEIVLDFDTFNIGRREDRSRLATSAAKAIKTKTEFGREQINDLLSNFCWGLKAYLRDSYQPEMVSGDETNTPPSFILKPFILEEAGTILFGPPGRGKSFMALLMTICVDAGINKFWVTRQVPTLFINLERSAKSVRRRIGAINRILGLPATRPIQMINARGQPLARIVDKVINIIEKQKIGFVVLDSISRTGYGDLTKNETANDAIDALNSMGCAWLALGHTSWEGERNEGEGHIFGSIHYRAGADIDVQLLSEVRDNTLGVGLQMVKANDVPHAPLEVLALTFEDYSLKQIEQASTKDFLEINAGRRKKLIDEIREYLLDIGEATPTQIADSLARPLSKVSTTLNLSHEFNKRKDGRRVYYSVKSHEPEIV